MTMKNNKTVGVRSLSFVYLNFSLFSLIHNPIILLRWYFEFSLIDNQLYQKISTIFYA